MKQLILFVFLLSISLFFSVDNAYSIEVREDSCDQQMPGDADGNGVIDDDDYDFLYAFLFYDGPAPNPLANGDCNGDCIIDEWDLLCNGGVDCTCENPVVAENPDTCFYFVIPGDADGSGVVDLSDISYIISYLQGGGPAPTPRLANGDANGDCYVDMDDAAYINCNMFFPLLCPLCDCTCINPRLRGQSVICGDTDGSDEIDISDAVFLIAYIFSGGPAPNPLENADVDCTGFVDVSDAVYLIAFIFGGGPAPCDGCI